MKRGLFPVLILAALLGLRGWQLSQRTFYWDDLVIPPSFRDSGLWAPYDGHLMPGSAALQVAVDSLAPLQWWLPCVVTLAATALAAVLWWILLGRLTERWGLRVLGFTALVFSPFLGAATGWWSAGVNALAWQLTAAGVGLALTASRGVVLRTTLATLVLLGGLLMTERALTVVPAVLAVALVLRLRRGPSGDRLVLVVPALLTLAWAGVYLAVVGRGDGGGDAPGLHGVTSALGSSVLPGVFGGPWSWDRWNPSPAFSTTPSLVQVILAVLLAALLVWTLVRARRRPAASIAALAASCGYLLVVLLLLREGRTGDGASDLLARGMHYYADWWTVTVVLVVAAAPVLARTWTAALAAVLFALSSTVSTVTWVSAWSDDETAAYLAGVRQAASEAQDVGTVLLDQNTPLEVLTPLMSPYNRVGALAAGVGDVSTAPTVVLPDGRVAEAEVLDISRSAQGDVPDCGVRVDAGQPQIITVEPALPFGDWTWEFTATADQELTVQLSTPNGLEDEAQWRARAVDVDVDTDLVTRWVNLSGGGGTIMAEIDGPPGSHMCVGAGAVGALTAR
ncbi:hypothetical protein ACT3SZ_11385 [Corynebacterium sp. AOP40-9SA-29]|uniref:hypothetical protein n=1 Tax=Corynebacterium sp. AOP40-9SA-29 TaxID=3457677 RepID=UPI00403421F8